MELRLSLAGFDLDYLRAVARRNKIPAEHLAACILERELSRLRTEERTGWVSGIVKTKKPRPTPKPKRYSRQGDMTKEQWDVYIMTGEKPAAMKA